MKFFGKKIGNILVPDGTESVDDFTKLPSHKTLMCEATQPRNLAHHKLYFSLCARIAAGIGQTTDWVDRAFRIEAGHVDVFEYGGKTHLVVRSLSFAKQDQIAFSEYFESCVQIAYGKWHVPPESINDLLLPQGME